MKHGKRILTLLLVAVMTLSLVACGENKKAEGAQIQEGSVVLPEGFTAGFGRADITPTTFPIPADSNGSCTSVADSLYATCVAVSDGTDVALLFSIDMKNIPEDFFPYAAERIEEAFGIPADNVILNAMHTHNAPAAQSTSKTEIMQWREFVYQGIVDAAREALLDLAPATAFTGRSDTTGLAFVRRYMDMSTGQVLPLSTTNMSGLIVDYESEADPELRTLRFDRGEKKDIVMVNWQAHAASAATDIRGMISADYVGVTRKGVEADLDVHFAFYMGASANIELYDRINHADLEWQEVGVKLVDHVKEALASETPAEVGDVRISKTVINGKVIQETPERIMAAQAYTEAKTAAEKEQVIKDYNLNTEHDVTAIQYRTKYGTEHDIPLTAVSFGDFAFAAAPYEMFDTNGMDIRNGVPFKTTFICSLSNANLGYFPDSDIWNNGGYEVVASRFEKGHAELCANTLIDMLKAQAG